MNTHLIKKIASTKNNVKFDLNFTTSTEEDFEKFQMYLSFPTSILTKEPGFSFQFVKSILDTRVTYL